MEVTANAYFEKGALVVDGHDSGKRVKEMFGSGEYDYQITVPREMLPLLCKHLNLKEHGEENVLGHIHQLFNGNDGFSRFRSFLDHHLVMYDYLSWS